MGSEFPAARRGALLEDAVGSLGPGAGGEPDELAEASRNRLLRRVDWRFLLAEPGPRKTICFDAALVEAVGRVSGTVVEARIGEPEHSCDLAVAINPGEGTAVAAAAALQPGGAFYSEWTRFRLRSRKRIRRRLSSAGFDTVDFYWPDGDPSVASPAAWLPLDSHDVLRHYFVHNRGRSRTALRRAVRGVLRWGRALAPRLRLARPVCSLAWKASRQPATSTTSLRELVRERWSAWNLGPMPKPVSWLLLTGGLRSDSKVILLGFPEGEKRPRIAVKMPRTPESAPAVVREGEVLQALQARLGTDFPEGIPRPLHCGPIASTPILVETAFTGTPLLSAWNRSNYAELLLRAAAWLAGLAGGRPAVPPETWRPRLVDDVLNQFASSYGAVLDPRFLRDLESALRVLPPLPLVCEQRDFSPWNVLLTPEGQLAVVDWESAELDGLPALDLLYFLVNAGFSLDGARRTGRYRESYRNTLDPSAKAGAVAAECLAVYCGRTGIDPSCIPALRLLAWLRHTRSDYARLSTDAGGRPEPAALRRSVYLTLCEEELLQHG